MKKSKLYNQSVWENYDEDIRSVQVVIRYRKGSRLTKKLQAFVQPDSILLDISDTTFSIKDTSIGAFFEKQHGIEYDGLYKIKLSYSIKNKKEVVDFWTERLYSKRDASDIMKMYGFYWAIDSNFKTICVECFCGNRTSSGKGHTVLIDRSDLSSYGRRHLNKTQKLNLMNPRVYVPIHWIKETKTSSVWQIPEKYRSLRVECPYCEIASKVEESASEAAPLFLKLYEYFANFNKHCHSS